MYHHKLPILLGIHYYDYRKLVTDPKDRLGVNGVEEIKAHPFFSNINWQKLRYDIVSI
jgi:hypothetical protein